MKQLPLLRINVDNYGMYNHPPTKKEGGRMAIIIRDVVYNNRILLKKGTKGSVIPFGNFGLYMKFKDYTSWLRQKPVKICNDILYESSRLSRTYDFFHTYMKDGKEKVGSWHTYISRLDFEYVDNL